MRATTMRSWHAAPGATCRPCSATAVSRSRSTRTSAAQAYQGIVELSGPTLTDCMQTYFRQSEQLKTGLKIAVDRIADGGGARWRGRRAS